MKVKKYLNPNSSILKTAKQYAKDIKEQVLTPIIEEPQKFISRAIMAYAQQSLPGLANPFKDSRIWNSMVSDHGTAQDTYLMSRRLQDKIFKEKGYIPGKEGDYGLVKKAVGNRKLPIYQTAPDAISRDKLIFLGNDGYYWADHGLENPGSYPHASYTDGHGNFYQKAWDLNDYGGKGGATAGVLGNIVDFIGNPVVVTTGFQKMDINDPWAIEALASDMAKKGLVPTKINGKIEWTLPEVVVKGKIKKKSYGGNLFEDGGKMNTLWFLKNGSGIHIKKKNRGKFTSYCGGKVTDSCIRRAKASGNPTLIKRATFADNARHFKHRFGGLILQEFKLRKMLNKSVM